MSPSRSASTHDWHHRRAVPRLALATRRSAIAPLLLAVAPLLVLAAGALAAQPDSTTPTTADPAEPFAAVEGVPIFRGELNLLLAQRVGAEQLSQADPRLMQAAALTLVRRHLAMRTLAAMGGEALQAKVEQAVRAASATAERQGDTLQAQALRSGADAAALGRDLAWQTAWGEYLRSRLTQENLQRFFDANRAKYDGTRLRVSQIFVPAASDAASAGPPPTAALQQLADRIRQSDDVPAAFALAARDHSHGGSADEGGHLGWVTASGDLPAAVTDAVLQAEPNEVVGPIVSPLGLHLLLVHERQAGDKGLEEIEDQAQLRRDAADAMFRALVRRQSSARVQWFDASVQPPAEIPIIP